MGLYKTACEAALAYDRAAVAINGECALTNFPPPPSHARQDSCGIRKLLEAKALTDSEGSDGQGDSWERGSPQPLSRIERPLKRPRVGAGGCGSEACGGGGDAGTPRGMPSRIPAKYLGVWRKAEGPWRASVFKGDHGQKRTLHLGCFSCALAAALAYDRGPQHLQY